MSKIDSAYFIEFAEHGVQKIKKHRPNNPFDKNLR